MKEQRGHWRLERELGRGGLGVVWLARDPEGREAALKTVSSSTALGAGALAREVALLAHLEHPGVVRILDHGLHEGQPWYAMERLEAVPLDAFLRASGSGSHSTWIEVDVEIAAREPTWTTPAPRPATWDRGLRLVRRVCDPLGWLHGEGIVHRDLKPGNVLVRVDGSPVLVDFGLAAAFSGRGGRDRLDGSHVRAGTPLYMAPEQIRGDRIDARADLYALGCMLYLVISGRPPYLGSPRQVLEQHLTAQARPLSDRVDGVPPQLDDLVLSLLARSPERRPGYAEDVAAVLDGLLPRPEPPVRPAPRPHVYRPRLVGRQEELAALEARLDALEQGRGGAVVLAGPSGTGKTRLALEAARAASHRRLRVHAASCVPGGSRPLGVLAPVLEEAASRPWFDEPALAPVWGQASTAPALEGRAAELRLLDAVSRVLRRLSAERPFVLLADDLQWADPLSLVALHHVLHPQALPPLLVVATARESARLLALDDLPDVQRVDVGPLAPAEVHGVVEDMLARAPADVVADLAERAGGLPMAAAELVRTAVAEGWLRRRAGAWELSPDRPPGRFARDLGELVARRLDALDAASREVVGAASVLGDLCTVDRLAKVLGPVDPVVLADLRRREVLDVDVAGGVEFVHDAVCEGALAALPPARRTLLHGRVADLLEGPPLARATHLEHAGRAAEAVEAYREGARQAAEASAWDAACAALDRAVALQAPSPDRATDRFRRARAQARRAPPPDVLAHLLPALDEAGDDVEVAVEALLRIARAHLACRDGAAAIAALARALDRLGPAGRDGQRLAVLTELAQIHANSGDPASARSRMDEVEVLAARGLGSEARFRYYGTRAVVAFAEGRIPDAIAEVRASLAAPLGDADRAASLWQLAYYQAIAGDPGAEATLQETHDLALRTGDLARAAGVSLMRGVLAGRRRDVAGSIVQFARALELFGRVRDDGEVVNCALNLGLAHGELGDVEAAREHLAHARRVLDRVSYPRGEAMWRVMRATVERQAGTDPATLLPDVLGALEGGGLAAQDQPMAACEAGHLALALGRSAAPWIARARELAGPDMGFADEAIAALEAAEAERHPPR